MSNRTQAVARARELRILEERDNIRDGFESGQAVSQFTEAEVYREIGTIASNFPLLECDKCARAVMRWLDENGIERKILQLKTKRRNEVFITSDRWNFDESITENGTHYGVEVFGRVFDNLSTEGLLREDWLKSFHCPSEQFMVTELESL